MTRGKKIALALALAPAGALVLAAAVHPAALAQVSGGLWELTGPHMDSVRECLPDPMILAQFEHRNAKCTQTLISDGGSQAVVEYKCAGGGFGRSEISVVTPRSLKIDTQGISDNFPFSYTLEARRVGDCAATQAGAQSH